MPDSPPEANGEHAINSKTTKILVCNGDEGDPGAFMTEASGRRPQHVMRNDNLSFAIAQTKVSHI